METTEPVYETDAGTFRPVADTKIRMQTPKARSPLKSAVLVLGVVALLAVATGCSSDSSSSEAPATTEAPTTTEAPASSSLSGAAVAKVLETSTKGVLVDQSITLDGELACTADISLTQGTVTGSCAGTDSEGNAIASTLDGTAKLIGVNSCSGTFKVTQGTQVINENKNFNCFL